MNRGYDWRLRRVRSMDTGGITVYDSALGRVRLSDSGDSSYDPLLGFRLGSNVNQPATIGTPVIDSITDTGFVISCLVTPGSSPVTPSLAWGTTTGYAGTPVNATEGEISEVTECHFTVTGLTAFTNYFFKVVAGEVESAGGFTIPEELRDSSLVSWIRLNTNADFYSYTTTNILLDRSQGQALAANVLTAPASYTGGWSALEVGRYQYTGTSDGQMNQTTGNVPFGYVWRMDYEIESTDANGTLFVTAAGSQLTSLVKTVGTGWVYIISNAAGNNFAIRMAGNTSGSLVIKNITLRQVAGNHLFTRNDNYHPAYNSGALYNGSNDYSKSFATAGLSCYLIAKKTASDLDFKVYTDLAGLGELNSGTLTLGGNHALSAYYGQTTKHIILRNTATISQNVLNYLDLLNSTKALPRMIIPSNIYAVVGKELALYADQVCYGTDSNDTSPSEYTVEFVCAKGTTTGRKYAFTPESGDVGTVAMTINAINKITSEVIQTKTTTINVIAATAPATVRDVTMLGDSLTDPGVITTNLQALFTGIDNAPLFKGAYGTAPTKHTGYSGNDISNFMSSAARRWKFVVSGVTTAPSRYATYTNNSSTFQVMEVVLSGGTGYIKCNRTAGTNSPSVSGTLTRTAGTGDNTITYSAGYDAPASPFFTDAGVFSMSEYKTNAGITNLGVFTIQLGANSSNTAELSEVNRAAWITSMKTFVDAILTGDPTSKVIINITTQDSHNPDGWGTTFPTDYQNKQNFRRNLRRLWELIIDEFDEGAYHANVFVGVAGLGLNRANPPFTVDQFHPNADGSEVMAMQQFPLILKLLQ